MIIESNSLNKISYRTPFSILIPLFLIIFIGILNLASAAQATRPDLYLSQMSKFGFALCLMLVLAFVDTRWIKRVSYLVYGFAIFLLLLVLVVGTSAKGAQRWLVLGTFRLQPSDPAKLAVILAIARYCSLYWPQKGYNILTLLRPLNFSRPIALFFLMLLIFLKPNPILELLPPKFLMSFMGVSIIFSMIFLWLIWMFLCFINLKREGISFCSFIAPIDIAVLPFLLVAVEPDLATGIVILSICGIMFLYVGISKSSLIIGFISFLFIATGAYFTLLKDYQKQRIISFLNQEADLHGDGYQAMQSIIAIGSGKAIGKGFSGGTQTQLSFLPENSTDFAFSVWAEEWGFLFCSILLMLYFFVIIGCLKICLKTNDKFSQLICVGVAANIFVHVMVNIGMVTGILPVAGVPLLFISYGGSAMTTSMLAMGLVVNVCLWRGAVK